MGVYTGVFRDRDKVLNGNVSQSRFTWRVIGYSKENLPSKVKLHAENIYIVIWNGVLAVMTSCHVILGEFVFCSMLFISAR